MTRTTMVFGPFTYFWELTSAPLDEAQRERVQTLQQALAGDYFKVKVRVKQELCFPEQLPIIPFLELFSCESSMLLSSPRFLEEGAAAAHFQTYYPDPIIPHELVPVIAPHVTAYANALVKDCGGVQSANFRLFSLVLDVVIQITYDEGDEDVVSELLTMEDITGSMVPASKTAIQSLKKVRLENDDAAMETCSICLTQFVDGMEVSAMPCKHLYHQQCITQWLETSHMCPLCRYRMPTPE